MSVRLPASWHPQWLDRPADGLGYWHRPAILAHLERLSRDDRYQRFGGAVTDDALMRYVDLLDFQRDAAVGVFLGDALIAFAHVAMADGPTGRTAEIALSVDSPYRGQRLGARLLERAIREAAARGAEAVVMHFTDGSESLARLARGAGMAIHRGPGGEFAYRALDDGAESGAAPPAPGAALSTLADMPKEVRTVLARNGILLVSDLLHHSPEDLLRLPGFGMAALAGVVDSLARLGLRLRTAQAGEAGTSDLMLILDGETGARLAARARAAGMTSEGLARSLLRRSLAERD